MKDEDIDKRHAAAYRVAGQAVMAFYLGGSVNDEGVEIDERRYCGLSLPFGHDAQAKERFLLLWILQAGAQSTYGRDVWNAIERVCCQAHGARQAERS